MPAIIQSSVVSIFDILSQRALTKQVGVFCRPFCEVKPLTNEELALRIKDGEKKLTIQLWEQVKGFAVMKSWRYCRGFRGWAEMDDYLQTAFVALMNSITQYNPEYAASFLTQFYHQMLHEFKRVIGDHGHLSKAEHESKFDLLIGASSLDEPLNNTKGREKTRGEIIPDKAETYEQIIDKISLQQDVAIVLEQMNKCLTPMRKEAVCGFYLKGQTTQQLAEQLQSTEAGISTSICDSLAILREVPEIKALKENYVDSRTNFYQRKGVSAHQCTGASSVEDQVERRERIAEGYLRAHKKCSLNVEQVTQIIALRERGTSIPKIAEQMQLGRNAVDRTVKIACANIQFDKHASQKPDTAATILKLFQSGMSRRKIMEQLGVSESYVDKSLRPFIKPSRPPLTNQQVEQIIRLYTQKISGTPFTKALLNQWRSR